MVQSLLLLKKTEHWKSSSSRTLVAQGVFIEIYTQILSHEANTYESGTATTKEGNWDSRTILLSTVGQIMIVIKRK